jgi:hypothetical protein
MGAVPGLTANVGQQELHIIIYDIYYSYLKYYMYYTLSMNNRFLNSTMY